MRRVWEGGGVGRCRFHEVAQITPPERRSSNRGPAAPGAASARAGGTRTSSCRGFRPRYRTAARADRRARRRNGWRSEEHTSELQSLMRISYAVFCLKKKTVTHPHKSLITKQRTQS